MENAIPGRIEYDEGCQEQLVASVIASCFGGWTKKDQETYLVDTLISARAEQIRAQTAGQPREHVIAAVREATREGNLWAVSDEAKARMAREMLDPLVRSMMALYICRGFLKSRGFAEEREWRLLAIRPTEDTSGVQFRVSKGILIPYVTLDLRNDDGRQPIERVIVGPTANQANAKRSVERFLRCKGLQDVRVEGSSISLL